LQQKTLRKIELDLTGWGFFDSALALRHESTDPQPDHVEDWNIQNPRMRFPCTHKPAFGFWFRIQTQTQNLKPGKNPLGIYVENKKKKRSPVGCFWW
jgi:hypothetical protein